MKILLILIISACLQGNLQAQNDFVPTGYFSAIIVSNLDKSIEWYSEVLDLELIDQVDLPERGIRQANLKNNGCWIELIQLKNAISRTEIMDSLDSVNLITGIFKIGFRVKNFDEWVKFVNEENLELHGGVVIDKNSNKRMMIVKDPDGNRIQFFES